MFFTIVNSCRGIGPRHVHAFFPIELLVKADQNKAQCSCENDSHCTHGNIDRKCNGELGGCARGIEERRIDLANIAGGGDQCLGCGAFASRPWENVGDITQRHNVTRIDARDHETHSGVSSGETRSGEGDDEGYHSKDWRNRNVIESLTGLVSVPCVDQDRYRADEVWRCRQQQGSNIILPESLHHSGKEISDGAGCSTAEKHTPEEEDLPIREGQLRAVKHGLMLGVDPVVFADVLF